jgi:acyl-coenzyme A thioesterase PaaI-like protein
MPNRMTQMVERLNRFSPALRYFLLSKSFGRVVPFFGTAGIRIEELSHSQVVMTLQNRRKVQNHIRTVHAAAMTLLAESATGILMGMNVPDDKYLVIKSLHVDFQKKASGAMKAVATLTPEQVLSAQNDAEGEILVSVSVSDASGNEPVSCQMLWAWKPKRA